MTELTATLKKGGDSTVSVTINGITTDGFSVVRRDAASVELRRTSTGIVERVVVAPGQNDKPVAVLDLSHPDAWAPPPEPEQPAPDVPAADAAPAVTDDGPPEVGPAASAAPAKPARRSAAPVTEPVTTDLAAAPAEG